MSAESQESGLSRPRIIHRPLRSAYFNLADQTNEPGISARQMFWIAVSNGCEFAPKEQTSCPQSCCCCTCSHATRPFSSSALFGHDRLGSTQPPSQWFLSPLLGPLYVTSHNFLIKKSFVCIKRPPLSCPPQRGFSEPLAQLYNISIRQRSERPTPHRLHRVAFPSSRPSCFSPFTIILALLYCPDPQSFALHASRKHHACHSRARTPIHLNHCSAAPVRFHKSTTH